MVRISRNTQASAGPIPIRIVTDRVSRSFTLPGPMSSIEVPGDRVYELIIANAHLYGIRIVIDGDEYRPSEISDDLRSRNVEAIIIFDGFLWNRAPMIPGYTYRPQFIRDGTLVESGKSFIYPGQCINRCI